MRQKKLALVLIILPLIIIGCGDGGNGGTTSDTGVKWVGEVFTGSSSESSTVIGEFTSVIGEFTSYDDCIAAIRKESESAVSNCGIK